MSVNSASSSITAISLAYISSPDDALDLSNATQSDLTDQMRGAISTQITVAASLVNRLIKINQILTHLQKYGTGSFKPVSAESLAATPKTSDALKSLFLNDGPSLGIDNTEATSTISDLAGMGITINAPRLTPVLFEIYDKKGTTLLGKSFVWYDDTQRKGIGGTAVQSKTYPGANEQTNTVFDFKVVSYSFDQYSKFSPSQTDVNTAISQIEVLANSLDAEFAARLDETAKASDKLQKIVDDNADSKKSQSQQISALAAQQQEQLANLLNKLRMLKLDRETNRQIQEQKIGPEVSSIVKNASDRVEGISGIEDGLSRASISTGKPNNTEFQLQTILASLAAGQSLNGNGLQGQPTSAGLAAGPNSNTPENRIPV